MLLMRQLIIRGLTTIVIAVSIVSLPADAWAQVEAQSGVRPLMRRPIPAAALRGSTDFVRTELFFGTAQPDGVVTDAEFFEFLDRVITPRFPDGLTLLKGDGQFRNAAGQIIKEDSFVLILLYPLEDFRESSRRINVIRERYKDEFQQESVLRVDDPWAVRVSF
jgi:hypothetical protein